VCKEEVVGKTEKNLNRDGGSPDQFEPAVVATHLTALGYYYYYYMSAYKWGFLHQVFQRELIIRFEVLTAVKFHIAVLG
jgi:hypothetical protein